MSDERFTILEEKLEKIMFEILDLKNSQKNMLEIQRKEFEIHQIAFNNLRKKIEGNGKKGLEGELEEVKNSIITLKIFNAKLIGGVVVFNFILTVIIALYK